MRPPMQEWSEEKTDQAVVEAPARAENLQDPGEDLVMSMATLFADRIRNPLTGIAQTVALLEDELKDEVDGEKLEIINRCVQKIDSFIEDLYLLSRPVNPSFIEVNLNAFIQQAARQFFEAHPVNHRIEPAQTDIYVLADYALLQHAVNNLLENAVEAIGDDGEIRVSVSRKMTSLSPLAPSAVIVVQDNGEGIAQSIMPEIFKPFFTTKYENQGLGLIIARNFIRLHGGDISIHSNRMSGTKVEVSLPILRRRSSWSGGGMFLS